MEMHNPKKHPGPLQVGLQCALVVFVFACLVLAIHYFPEEWLSAMAARRDASDEAFMAMINSLVVPWWLVLVAVCIHLWTTCVAWKLRDHPQAASGGISFLRGKFKNFTEGATLMLIGLYAHLGGLATEDVILLLASLVLVPRIIRLFLFAANPKL